MSVNRPSTRSGHPWLPNVPRDIRGKDIQINVLVPGEARTEMNQGSTESPYAVVSMVLVLLSHPPGGPNGHFFNRDGRHLAFAYTQEYSQPLLDVR